MKTTATTTLAALLMLAACSDSTGPTNGTQVALSFTSNVSSGAAAAAPGRFSGAMAAPITDGTNTLDITSVKVVLREIELKRVEVTDCDVEPEPDGCEKFETGPLVIDLPLDGSTSSTLEIMIDPGTYTELEFDIHKVSSEDTAFLSANPSMEGMSILVQGTYNGETFTFETDLNEEQEFDLVPNLVIDEDSPSTNVTIRVDVSTWFVDQSGNLFNPETAAKGEPNENLAKDNIKDSIEAFEDKDRDGDDSDEG
jgi:hypothetical protein